VFPLPPALPQTSRENKYAEIRRTLEDFIRTRSKTDEKFQAFVEEELAALKNDISNETQVGRPGPLGKPVLESEVIRLSTWVLRACCPSRPWQIRVREDDEIVDALNRYTSKLQQSLKIINSTEM
jgi:hypothetical protein